MSKLEEDIDYSNLTKEELEDLLTTNQIIFCHYYMESLGNGTSAYKRLKDYKCSDSVAHGCASKILRKATVKEYIRRLRAEIVKDIDIGMVIKSAQRTYDECMKPKNIRVYDPSTKAMKETGESYIDSKGANGSLEVLIKAIAESKKVSLEDNEDAEINLAMNFVIKQKRQVDGDEDNGNNEQPESDPK